jgi:hypothetical protein
MDAQTQIKVQGISIEHTEIEISEAVYRQAIADERLDHELDVYLSDMDGETFVIEPDGIVVDPYGNAIDVHDLLDMVRPVLEALPTWMVEQYVADRRADEE